MTGWPATPPATSKLHVGQCGHVTLRYALYVQDGNRDGRRFGHIPRPIVGRDSIEPVSGAHKAEVDRTGERAGTQIAPCPI
jgi:hypothetical protein